MKLKFNSDAWYNGVRLYEAGKIYEVSEENGFAARWIKRGAEEVTMAVPVLEPVVEPVIEPEKQPDLDVEIKKEVEETDSARPVKPVVTRGKRARSAIEEL